MWKLQLTGCLFKLQWRLQMNKYIIKFINYKLYVFITHKKRFLLSKFIFKLWVYPRTEVFIKRSNNEAYVST